MLLKSIKLENFRQFRDSYIEFAQGTNGKNVTIIMGNNATGKTTMAQAFRWCMYGDTEFSDKNMLNRNVAYKMTPGQKKDVKVTLEFSHGDLFYTLIREQTYSKGYNNRIQKDDNNTTFSIAITNAKGSTNPKIKHPESEMNKILPQALSQYFFFDGERIEKMSKYISGNVKVTDIAEAVQGLLGLNAMQSALRHLYNPRRINTVIGKYESSYAVDANEKLKEIIETLNMANEKIFDISLREEELKKQIDEAKAQKENLLATIKDHEEGDRLLKEKERINKHIDTIHNDRNAIIEDICNYFKSNINSYFSEPLIFMSLKFLSQKDFTGKDIPHMHADTIEYLLNKKECICGTHLDKGSIPYEKVKKLIDFLPPQSLSTSIGDFKKEAKLRAISHQDLYAIIGDKLARIEEYNDQIDGLNEDLNNIESKLKSGNINETVRDLNNKITTCDQTIEASNVELEKLLIETGEWSEKIKNAEKERKELALTDKNNKKIEIYRSYAMQLYNELNAVYSSKEKEIREKLATTINEIFKTIFSGALSLTIDEKYHIKVFSEQRDDDVETSTAQSISVIFAFITAIIKIAKENQTSYDKDAELLTSDSYPLVMDAPLSSFDKRRIKTVCELIPTIAEQVIIFIKDTDGEFAEEYMSNKIGSHYTLDKRNEFETVLM